MSNVWLGTAVFQKNGKEHEALVFGDKIPNKVAIHLSSHQLLFPGDPEPESFGLFGTTVAPVEFFPADAA